MRSWLEKSVLPKSTRTNDNYPFALHLVKVKGKSAPLLPCSKKRRKRTAMRRQTLWNTRNRFSPRMIQNAAISPIQSLSCRMMIKRIQSTILRWRMSPWVFLVVYVYYVLLRCFLVVPWFSERYKPIWCNASNCSHGRCMLS